MQRNPFLSKSFTGNWSRHFAPGKAVRSFAFIPSLEFTKIRFLPLFTNVGKTMTKGIDYELEPGSADDYQRKVFLIYDVPTYFEIGTDTATTDLAVHRTQQYPGFLIDLKNFNSLNDYLLATFSKNSRYKLKKYKKRFEASFDVRYVMFRGEMERETYDQVFLCFRDLLEKRFDDKQITNNNLNPKEWQFYYEVTYPMLLENRASLFVVYNGDTPIGITLNFFSENILFDAITVFDIDYAKFHLGSITIMGLLEWCLIKKIRIFDFSKGYFDYKSRWATKAYDFEYHIYYDSASIRARTIAFSLKIFFDLKQRLRQRKINEQWHRITYRFKKKTKKTLENKNYSFAEIEGAEPIGTSYEVALNRPENQLVRLMVFEYLYLHEGRYRDIKVYATNNIDHYHLLNKTKWVLATLQ